MNIKRIISFAVAAVLCLAFSGCSAEDEPGLGGLLSAPKMSEQQKQIHEALIAAVGNDITLKYPANGDNRSAFVIENIDEEDTDEAIVFYKYTNSSLDEGTVRVNILDQDSQGNWFSAVDFAGSGAEVDRIFTVSLYKDAPPSLVIGYSTLSANENQFQVYSYSGENIDTVYTDTYSLLTVVDLNSDGVYDIFKTAIDPKTGAETGAVLEREQSGFKAHANIEMSGYTSSYALCRQGKTQGGKQALFVDSLKSDGNLQTDIITEGYGTYQNPSVIFKDRILKNTTRPSGYLTADVEGDGIYEIPKTSIMAGYDDKSENPQLLTAWQSYDDSFSLKEKFRGYYMLNDGYFLNFTEKMQSGVTVKIDEKTGESVYYKLNGTAENSKTELFRINVVNASEYENYRALGYMLITEQGQLKYVVKRTGTNEDLCLKLDEIKENFYVIN